MVNLMYLPKPHSPYLARLMALMQSLRLQLLLLVENLSELFRLLILAGDPLACRFTHNAKAVERTILTSSAGLARHDTDLCLAAGC